MEESQESTIFSKLGGRKAVMAIVCIAAGVSIEIFGKNGLGAQMVALLTAIYGTFSVTNTVITNATAKLASSQQPVAEPAETAVEESAPVDLSANISAQIAANNQQLSAILNQIAQELSAQKLSGDKALEALNTVQAGQATVQKGLSILLGRGT